MASITAAYELTRPEHRGRFQVTLYQQGWRLGGKGASGRGASGRIEEHGLHVWFGFYENAFRLLRECYGIRRDLAHRAGTLDRLALADWTDAFVPQTSVTNMDVGRQGEWLQRTALFPPAPGLPGDAWESGPATIQRYLGRALDLMRVVAREVETRSEGGGVDRRRAAAGPAIALSPLEALEDMLRSGAVLGVGTVSGALGLASAAFAALNESTGATGFLRLAGLVDRIRGTLLTSLVDERDDFRVALLDMMGAIVVGAIRDGLVVDRRGLDAVDRYDLREWLMRHGASARTVQSAFVRGLYDLVFAYRDGDPSQPALSAAQGLRGIFRMFFGHRGALLYKMRAGMGDVVFTPFYEVLLNRGVDFRFFHRLRDLRVASGEGGEPGHVRELHFDVQARVKGGGAYAPLVDFAFGAHGKVLGCWPNEPLWDQLENGDRLKKAVDDAAAQGKASLRGFESHWQDWSDEGDLAPERRVLKVTEDFDAVVLGVSLHEVTHVCKDLIARDDRWREMVRRVRTVATQAFQLWLREDRAALGWKGGATTLSGFVQPFDTYADMGQVTAAEDWTTPPRSIAYFCSALPELPMEHYRHHPAGYADERQAEVRENAIRFLDGQVRHLWPRACDAAGNFRWELLADAEAGGAAATAPAGAAAKRHAMDTQFWTANVNPTDRYVQSMPGSTRYRISPLDRRYDNLTIAGDWTDCGFNFGCVEAAVMSGRLAAHALSETPALDDIFGYDHP